MICHSIGSIFFFLLRTEATFLMSWKRKRSAQAKETELDGPILLGKPLFLRPSTSSGYFFSSFSEYRVLEGKQIWFYLSRLVWIAQWRLLQWALLLSWSGSVNNSLDLPSCPPWLWPLLSGASAELVGTNKLKLNVFVSFIGCWVCWHAQSSFTESHFWMFNV